MARTFALIAVAFLLSGCGQKSQSGDVVAETTAGEAPSSVGPTVLQPSEAPHLPPLAAQNTVKTPQEVVQAFLIAVRAGDTGTTAALLTTKAREETAKHDLVVEPPGTPSAKFVVGEVQYIDRDQTGAHVNTVWTEADEAGSSVTYDVVWALRRQSDGWRVAGIATEIVDGQNPVFLNFEDPGDMLEKWRRAEEIAAQHQEQRIRQASAGGTRR